MSAYIENLQRRMGAAMPVAKSSLSDRFVTWYGALPEVARNRPFSMVEFEAALGTQGKYISPVLLQLGWQRKRRWSSHGQYHRYWVSPALKTPCDRAG
ncbi:hypothetical protein PanNE5_18530 [Pandoraea sp. NE5]|uniref:hypothetical protein n=1 Tax=Pandoraea sp. NE5 TaxID=2904129 RepID=UPI0021C274A4|nr:hypothetical protein [Pandoraea sp. NE5]BDD92413.1 hypothetical protein PanNE5_18530 [Pandoraea sp. NE5]